jgi:type VI protein secretion system component Hcp
MTVRRRTHARYPQAETDEYLRKRLDKHNDAAAVAEPGVVKMQHLVGNQAVQRLIQRESQSDNNADIQRDSSGKTEDEPRIYALATLVLNGSKVEGKSKLGGHEGKLEVMSINQGTDPAGNIEITITRVSDELTPKFNEAAAKGHVVNTAKFEFIRHGGPDTKINHVLDFSNGHISGFQLSTHEGVGTEAITITFGPAKKKEDD